jgi:hypothetical protein
MPVRSISAPVLDPLRERVESRLASFYANRNSHRVRFDKKRQVLLLVPGDRVLSGIPEYCRLRFSKTQRRAANARTGSSVTLGKRVHRQVEHWVNCQRDDTCTCGLQRLAGSKYRRCTSWSAQCQEVWKALDERRLVPVRAELPLLCLLANRATKLDLLCCRRVSSHDVQDDSFVLVSLKTGAQACQVSGEPMREPFGELADTETNVHMLQLLYEKLLLERDHETPISDALLLNVFKGSAAKSPGHYWQRLPGRSVHVCVHTDALAY